MDLNYLFLRQQVERSRADSALSEAARRAHAMLARHYEMQITHVTGGKVTFPGDRLGRRSRRWLPLAGVAGAAVLLLACFGLTRPFSLMPG